VSPKSGNPTIYKPRKIGREARLSRPLSTPTMTVSPSALDWPRQALQLNNAHQQDRGIAARAAKDRSPSTKCAGEGQAKRPA
jgi:hypothetical protein